MAASWFQRYLLPGFAFKAVVIGGGYATGRVWRLWTGQGIAADHTNTPAERRPRFPDDSRADIAQARHANGLDVLTDAVA